eukprot:SAG31_NODE_645_length_13244_cov_11.768903_10_plen_612_part_00
MADVQSDDSLREDEDGEVVSVDQLEFEPDAEQNTTEDQSPSFHSRSAVAKALENDGGGNEIKGWVDCIMEGYLAKGGGKSGDKKPKRNWFRMRSYMIVYYKDRKENPASYGKPKGKIPEAAVLFAASLDSPEMKQYRLMNEQQNSFLLVCTSRIFRLVAPTAQERDTWVISINQHVCDSENMIKTSQLGKVRASGALVYLGKKLKVKSILREIQMIEYLEHECAHNFKVYTVLEGVDHPDPIGIASDLRAAQLTNAVVDKMQGVIECIESHVDVESLSARFQSAGIVPHKPNPPIIQEEFQNEYDRAINSIFRGENSSQQDSTVENSVDLDDVFESELLFEDTVQIDHSLKSKARRQVLMKLYVDKLMWWPIDKKGRVAKRAQGAYNLRDVLHCDNTSSVVFRIVHFDEKLSLYCFCKSVRQLEILIDHISHAILDYNTIDRNKIAVAYLDKEKQVMDGLGKCRKALAGGTGKKKDDEDQMQPFQLLQLYLDGYVPDLFERLKEIRALSNEQRLKVGANNPHLAKRKVAADVDAAIHSFSMTRACIKAFPAVELYIDQLNVKYEAAQRILEMMTDEAMERLTDIQRMLDNELAEEEDLGVENTMLQGYGHD